MNVAVSDFLHLRQALVDIGAIIDADHLVGYDCLPLAAGGVVNVLDHVVELVIALLDINHVVKILEHGGPGFLQAQVGGDGRAGFALDTLALLAAEEAQHVLDGFQVLALGGGGVAEAVGDGGHFLYHHGKKTPVHDIHFPALL